MYIYIYIRHRALARSGVYRALSGPGTCSFLLLIVFKGPHPRRVAGVCRESQILLILPVFIRKFLTNFGLEEVVFLTFPKLFREQSGIKFCEKIEYQYPFYGR